MIKIFQNIHSIITSLSPNHVEAILVMGLYKNAYPNDAINYPMSTP